MDNQTQILFYSFSIAFIVTVLWWMDRRSKIILREWADENGFHITKKKQRYAFTGPFKWWTISRNQTIYSFTARDREGHERSGWARCGSYWRGVFFSHRIEIRWDQT